MTGCRLKFWTNCWMYCVTWWTQTRLTLPGDVTLYPISWKIWPTPHWLALSVPTPPPQKCKLLEHQSRDCNLVLLAKLIWFKNVVWKLMFRSLFFAISELPFKIDDSWLKHNFCIFFLGGVGWKMKANVISKKCNILNHLSELFPYQLICMHLAIWCICDFWKIIFCMIYKQKELLDACLFICLSGVKFSFKWSEHSMLKIPENT